jgi:hypothetical protein
MLFSHLLTTKDQALEKIENHLNWISTQFQTTPRSITTDGGGEFQKWKRICQSKGIQMRVSTPYTPEQNGRAEKSNHLVIQRARSMLDGAGIPLYLWPEAVMAATYVLNRTFSQPSGKSPLQKAMELKPEVADRFSILQPDITHLRILGCRAYVNIPRENRKASAKFAPRAQEGILIGYGGQRNYRIYIPQKQTVVTSCHVSFDEGKLPYLKTQEDDKDREVEESVQASTLSPPETQTIITHRTTNAQVPEPQATGPRRRTRRNREQVQSNYNLRSSRRTQQTQLPEVLQEQPPEETQRQPPEEPQEQPPAEPQELLPDEPREQSSEEPQERPPEEPQRQPPAEPYTREEPGRRDSTGSEIVVDAPQLPDSPFHTPATSPQTTQALLASAIDDQTALKAADYRESWELHEVLKMEEPLKSAFLDAAKVEIDSLHRNKTWDLVDRPKDRKILKGKWVFTHKRDETGEITHQKARWVVKGYEQVVGLDFDEIFASTLNRTTIKLILALATMSDWRIQQLDVVGAFLHPTLNKDIYVQQPCGFTDKSDQVCKLKKTLYGLRQSPREWEEMVKGTLRKKGYRPLKSDPCVLIRYDKNSQPLTIILVYVDDFLVTGPDTEHGITALKAAFTVKHLGEAKYYLGMRIQRESHQKGDQSARSVTFSQEAYADRVLARLQLTGLNPATTPLTAVPQMPNPDDVDMTLQKRYLEMLGSAMFAMTTTRPDLAFALGALARYAHCPSAELMKQLLHVYRYWKGTKHHGMRITMEGNGLNLRMFADAAHADDYTTRKSTAGYVTLVGTGGAISWWSGRTSMTPLSTTESEYHAMVEAGREAKWLNNLFSELNMKAKPIMIYVDNEAAERFAKSHKIARRTKHIDIQYHWIKSAVTDGAVGFKHVASAANTADCMTKPQSCNEIRRHREAMGVVPIEGEEGGLY